MLAELAPAKVNLALHVTGRRADGYHLLESLVVFAEVADALSAQEADKDALSISGPFATGLGAGANNLVLRALAAFRGRWPGSVPDGLSFHLIKNLPVASGLGGGSADAAAALRLLRSMSETPIGDEELFALAATLGADLPMCLFSQALLARGIGESLEPLDSFPPVHLVLVNPMIQLSTADVFRQLQNRDNPVLPLLPDPMTRPAQLGLWLTETRNDLEGPAIALLPIIGEMIERIRVAPGCMLARMSGSGATVFGVFGSGAQAHQAAHDLRAQWPSFWVAAAPVVLPDQ
jgi:4-diphosphocytidyl-2-C-methyl-D-erythritol kinase